MKFRTKIKDSKTFLSICKTAAGFSKKCIIRLAQDRLRFITCTSITEGGTQVWTSCKTETLFSDFKIESSKGNVIYVEIVDLTLMTHALRNCERSLEATMKLAQVAGNSNAGGGAYGPEGTGGGGAQVFKVYSHNPATGHDISQEVLVRVLGEAEIDAIVAPPLEDRMIQLVLPNLGDLALFIEKSRLNSAGQSLHLAVQKAGSVPGLTSNALTFTAHTITASFSLKYTDIEVMPSHAEQQKQQAAAAGGGGGAADEEEDDADADPPLDAASVNVEAKRFIRFLDVREVNPQHIVAHIVDERALVLSAYAHGETNLVYYIPHTMAQH